MKSIASLLVFILMALVSSSQSTNNKVTYKADGIYFLQLDKSGKEIARKPEGQNVLITYDKFFKSYEIYYYNSENKLSAFNLEFIVNDKNDAIKMKDKSGSIYYVMDGLSTSGKLKILIPKDYGDVSAWVVIEKAIKE